MKKKKSDKKQQLASLNAGGGYTGFFSNYEKYLTGKISWYIKIILFFIPARCRISNEGWKIVFKTFRGIIYILRTEQIPPEQYNCRCKLESV